MNHQENSQLNHRDTEDTEMNGGEGNFAPSDDTHIGVSNNLVVEPIPDGNDEVISSSDSSDVEVDVQQPLVLSDDVKADVHSEMTVERVAELIGDDILSVDAPSDVQETVVEQKTLQLPKQVSGWQRVQRFFLGSFAEDIARLNNLTQAIEDAPESSVNYVLRAELYMKMREYALAQLDFQRAYELAETHFELADWGLLEQVMRDRALTGLEKVQRRLR